MPQSYLCQPFIEIGLLGATVTKIEIKLTPQNIKKINVKQFKLFAKSLNTNNQWVEVFIQPELISADCFCLKIQTDIHNPICKLYQLDQIAFRQQYCEIQFNLTHPHILSQQFLWLPFVCPEKDKFSYGLFTDFSYSLHCPNRTNNKAHPLIICLHGAGEGGVNQENILADKLATTFLQPKWQQVFEQPYILAPQCPTFWLSHFIWQQREYGGKREYTLDLINLIKHIIAQYPDIDRHRVYLIGCSMGGYQALALLALQTNLFTAGIIACPAQQLTTQQLNRIQQTSLWFLHSYLDQIVPITNSQQMVTLLSSQNIVHTSYYKQIKVENKQVDPHAVFLKLYQNEPQFNGLRILDWLSLQYKL